jgi:hypothetical protein
MMAGRSNETNAIFTKIEGEWDEITPVNPGARIDQLLNQHPE